MKKIAILLSGNINCDINKKKIEAGYSFEKIINILRRQFENNYSVDYYVVTNENFDTNLFYPNLKNYKIIKDKYLGSVKKKFEYQFRRRKILSEIVDMNIDYYFYMFVRNDRLLVPNGEGLWDRTVTLKQARGWKKLENIDPKHYDKKILFKNNIDLSYLYIVPYSHNVPAQQLGIIFDGFAIGNFKMIKFFLDFVYENRNKPEIELKSYLDKNKVKIKAIDNILAIDKKDDFLNMTVYVGYGHKKR